MTYFQIQQMLQDKGHEDVIGKLKEITGMKTAYNQKQVQGYRILIGPDGFAYTGNITTQDFDKRFYQR